MLRWIKDELKRQRKTQSGLAAHMGRDKSVVSKMLAGRRRILAADLEAIASFLGKPVPTEGTINVRHAPVQSVTVTGVLAVGTWREQDQEPVNGVHHVPWVPDPRLLGMPQYARLVETSHASQVERGDYAIFVPFTALGRAPQDSDLVHCARYRDGLEEHTLRRVVRSASGLLLMLEGKPDQSLAWQPSSRSVSVLGLYIGAFRPPRVGK